MKMSRSVLRLALAYSVVATVVVANCYAQSPSLGSKTTQAAKRRSSPNRTVTQPDHQATLRGSLRPERSWWDVLHYDLSVEVFPEQRRIAGKNVITFRVAENSGRMQIDLQAPMKLTSATFGDTNVEFQREGNVYWLSMPTDLAIDSEHRLTLSYKGTPVVSPRPPWSGGFTWRKDPKGNHFIATSCQGAGASLWWPNKDHGADEPDRGVDLRYTVPVALTAVGNGRLVSTTGKKNATTCTYHWRVTQPINNYCVNLNAGNYVRLQETIQGEAGPLDMDYWVLESQKQLAEKHFREAPRTIKALEHWFGPYPFYEDSYKLVVVPYLGMEHQSSVTYGNGFANGYNGRDLSGTGVGMLFDFIIVHESGHEWFGNNVSMKDAADMWIHESFTNYSENLFVDYHFGKEEACDYVIGCRKLVRNDRPIIGPYGVNKSGSGDMYYKGGNMLHTIRHVIDDDEKWRQILRGINRDFRHQTVTTEQIERYMITKSGINLQSVFDQYLRTTDIPHLAMSVTDQTLSYHYEKRRRRLPAENEADHQRQHYLDQRHNRPPNTKTANAQRRNQSRPKLVRHQQTRPIQKTNSSAGHHKPCVEHTPSTRATVLLTFRTPVHSAG